MKRFFYQGVLLLIVIATCFSACSKEEISNPENLQEINQTIDEQLSAKPIEELCLDYFSTREDDQKMAKILINRTNEFFAINRSQKEFEGKQTCHIEPVYAYGIEGVAYYEIWLTNDGITPKGWLMFSATDKDYPLVNFSHDGIPYTQSLKSDVSLKSAYTSKNKIYRFGVSYFAMENEQGNLVAEFGEMPKAIVTDVDLSFGKQASSETAMTKAEVEENTELIEGVHYISIDSYDALRREFAKHYYTESRSIDAMEMRENVFPNSGSGLSAKSLKASWIYRWASGARTYYLQIPKNYGYNWTSCWSGCNNNAWANIYGWWDKNKGKSRLLPTTSTGETCPTYNNTTARRASADPVQMYTRSVCGTFCNSSGGGATSITNIWKGYKYAVSKGYGYSYWYRWCNSKGCHVDLANILTDCIANNYKPAHVSTSTHCYMGYGYAQWSSDTQRTWVYCYPGWKTNNTDNLWIHWRDLNCVVKLFIY